MQSILIENLSDEPKWKGFVDKAGPAPLGLLEFTQSAAEAGEANSAAADLLWRLHDAAGWPNPLLLVKEIRDDTTVNRRLGIRHRSGDSQHPKGEVTETAVSEGGQVTLTGVIAIEDSADMRAACEAAVNGRSAILLPVGPTPAQGMLSALDWPVPAQWQGYWPRLVGRASDAGCCTVRLSWEHDLYLVEGFGRPDALRALSEHATT